MPGWKVHSMFGGIASNFTSLFLIMNANYTPESAFIYSLLFIIGSEFPDVDQDQGKPGKVLIGTFLVLSLVGAMILAAVTELQMINLFLTGWALTVLLELVLRMFTHRGLLHHPAFGLMFTLFCVWISSFFLKSYLFAFKIFLGFYLGFLLHIILDKIGSRF